MLVCFISKQYIQYIQIIVYNYRYVLEWYRS